MILTCDWHLTDKIEDEYRWSVFDKLKVCTDGEIYILGDIADRPDRHSSLLVNRLVTELKSLTDIGNRVVILCGNHDKSIKPPPFFDFLNEIPGVQFITKPTARDRLLLLPHSSDPKADWAGIPFQLYDCVFLHQTVPGADVGGYIYDGGEPLWFETLAYSGDVHVPQRLGNLTYVGAPHPVKFGDGYRCRFLRLDAAFQVAEEITLRRVRKRIIEISSVDQLKSIVLAPGDQARVRFNLANGDIERWPADQEAIGAWARAKGVRLASVEAVVETNPDSSVKPFDFDTEPERVLQAYCQARGLGGQLLSSGLAFLKS